MTVSLSGQVEGPVTFDWSTLDGTALAGLDYEAVVNRTATIASGSLSHDARAQSCLGTKCGRATRSFRSWFRMFLRMSLSDREGVVL
jgi:hypothetical protein